MSRLCLAVAVLVTALPGAAFAHTTLMPHHHLGSEIISLLVPATAVFAIFLAGLGLYLFLRYREGGPVPLKRRDH
jgi:hypothetical protein